ncbi:ATP-binding protein [Pseudomonas sp. RP23018S]|uniref:hybrid sensor histidine kinase/response regulator n=1 Tax=Pseudomonas sp. RP23018S TaxID=3096037 RepID=UPI002ACAFC71|nr:ATP-binding protein [Pseudomonas sp. RP23018S]MDZ5604551.1 ATP-binding protein [Pseudomonas sp. RP23018S]
MKHASLRLDKLAQSSQRLNIALLLLTGLLLLLSSTCYWAISRLLESEQQRAAFHFARVIEIIHEHEDFLREVSALGLTVPPSATPGAVATKAVAVIGQQTLLDARAAQHGLPFTVAHAARFPDSAVRGALTWGGQASNFYGDFWANSFYASPQLFLLMPAGQASVAIPAAGHRRQHLQLTPEHFERVATRLRALSVQRPALIDHHIHWVRAPAHLYESSNTIVAITGMDSQQVLPANVAPQHLILAAVVDPSQVDEFDRVLRLSIRNQFTLVSPEGEVVMGDTDSVDAVPQGLSFDREGLRFKMVSASPDSWTALYAIAYQDFLRYAKWPLLGLGLTMVVAMLVGWWINRWYRSRIVAPAQRAQERLFESEAFNRIMLQNAPVGLFVVRRPDCQLLLENQRASQLGGTEAVTHLLTKHRGESAPGEMTLLLPDRYLQVVIVATRYEGQDVFLCGCNDITRHVGEHLTLNQAHRQATAANEAKTVFLATMSHEIRTPLYGVLGNLELLSLTEMSERQRQYLEVIEGSSTVLFQLISNVLDVSKIESGQMALELAPFDPVHLVEEAVLSFTAMAHNKGLAVESEIDPNVPAQIEGDAVRIRQILHNLLNNAIKFTESGRVRLRLTVQGRAQGNVALQWQVTDTGIGVPELALNELFKPFYQVAAGQGGGGAGLGLSICSRLSELMGGSMRAVSEPGLGSSFSLLISLPVVEVLTPAAPLSLLSSGADEPCLNLRVLVAEDNPVSQAVMREQLEALGALPTVARDGQHAMQLWLSQPFDLVITDINMPRLNGYDLARALRAQGALVPIIGITANALREEGQRCLAVGMNAWVVKPLSLGMLRQALLAHCTQGRANAPAPAPQPDSGHALDSVGWIELSPAMRHLMRETLLADIAQLQQGLQHGDALQVRQRLHSLGGALATVNAQALYRACQQLENALHDEHLGEDVVQAIQALSARLSTVAERLLNAPLEAPPA